MHSKPKPKLWRHLNIWFCAGNETIQYGADPKQAYDNYLKLLNECEKLRASKPDMKAD